MVKFLVREKTNGEFIMGINGTEIIVDDLEDLIFIASYLQEYILQTMLRKLEQRDR